MSNNNKKPPKRTVDPLAIGTKYGDLTVVSGANTNNDGFLYVECECKCGTYLDIECDSLTITHTTSCGDCGKNNALKALKEKAPGLIIDYIEGRATEHDLAMFMKEYKKNK